MKHTEFKVEATMQQTNFGGIELMMHPSGDGVYFRFNYGQDNIENEEIFEAEIEYIENEDTNEFEASFQHNENVYFLSKFLMVNR